MPEEIVFTLMFAVAGLFTWGRWQLDKSRPMYPSQLRDGSIIWVLPGGSVSHEREQGHPAHWYPEYWCNDVGGCGQPKDQCSCKPTTGAYR